MKIVKFENGNYGVRRWSVVHLRYVFASVDRDRIWYFPSTIRTRIETDLKGAEALLTFMSKQDPAIDLGKPVKRKTKIPPLGGAGGRCRCVNCWQ